MRSADDLWHQDSFFSGAALRTGRSLELGASLVEASPYIPRSVASCLENLRNYEAPPSF